jgi:coenzyme F420-reducing hydrogenase delta subunit
VSAAEGAKWAELVTNVVDEVRKLGPYQSFPKRLDGQPKPVEVA